MGRVRRICQTFSSALVQAVHAAAFCVFRPQYLSLPRLRTKFGERSFCPAVPATWNDLPEDMTWQTRRSSESS